MASLRTAIVAGLGACSLSYYAAWRRISRGNKEIFKAGGIAEDGSTFDVSDEDASDDDVTVETRQIGPLSVRCAYPTSSSPRRKSPVVLVHGMWHSTWYFADLQRRLAKQNFVSYSVDLNPKPLKKWKQFAGELKSVLLALKAENHESGPILLGHSQGGILVQTMLSDKALTKEIQLQGAILCGTIPLSPASVSLKLLREGKIQPQQKDIVSELGPRGNFVYWFFGTLIDAERIQKIFFLPTTTETTLLPGGMNEYYQRCLAAPSDGWPTLEHFFAKTPDLSHLENTPIFVVYADDDIIYQHAAVHPIFEQYYPHMASHTSKGQAHCFADPGWEETFADPVINWITNIAE